MSTRISNTDLIINPDGSIYHLSIKPHHVADTIIAVGDPGRVHRVSQFFDKVDFEMNKREFITHVGEYKGKRITVISSGMGTGNVEILLNELDALANIDLRTRQVHEEPRKLSIIRVGTSGSIQEDVRLGAHLMTEYAIGLDPLMAFYNLEMDETENGIASALQADIGLPFKPYCVRGSDRLIDHFGDIAKPGNTVTCQGFYAPQGRNLRQPIRYPKLINSLNYFHLNGLWLTNLEMETAAYYALARILGHDVLSLNAILANRIRNSFTKDPNRIVDSLIKKVLDKAAEL